MTHAPYEILGRTLSTLKAHALSGEWEQASLIALQLEELVGSGHMPAATEADRHNLEQAIADVGVVLEYATPLHRDMQQLLKALAPASPP